MTNPKNPYVGTFISTIMFPLFPDEIDLVPGITTHVSPATGFCGNTLQLFSNSPISELVTFWASAPYDQDVPTEPGSDNCTVLE